MGKDLRLGRWAGGVFRRALCVRQSALPTSGGVGVGVCGWGWGGGGGVRGWRASVVVCNVSGTSVSSSGSIADPVSDVYSLFLP